MGISSQLQEREKGDLPTMPAESRPNRRPLPILHLRFPLKTGTESSHSSLHTVHSLATEQLRPYTKSWVLLIDTDGHGRKDPASLWTRLADGKTLCLLSASRNKRMDEDGIT